MKILIVEDERELAHEIVDFLNGQQYDCHTVDNMRDGIRVLGERLFDAIILDLSLPDGDGMQLLKAVKTGHPDTFVIIASARGAIEDRIVGLQDGADDYLPKPFALAELHARLQAKWRRRYGNTLTALPVGDFLMDMEHRVVRFQEQEITLYKKEFDILSFLLLNKNRPLSRSQLYEHVWGDLSFPNSDSNYIDVHIKNIRKKLSVYAPVDWLQSVRGVGYKAICP